MLVCSGRDESESESEQGGELRKGRYTRRGYELFKLLERVKSCVKGKNVPALDPWTFFIRANCFFMGLRGI